MMRIFIANDCFLFGIIHIRFNYTTNHFHPSSHSNQSVFPKISFFTQDNKTTTKKTFCQENLQYFFALDI